MAGPDPEMLFLLGMVALIAIFGVVIPSVRLQRARKWPTARGTVEHLVVRHVHTTGRYGGDAWFSDVRYSYDAGQGRCTGTFSKGFPKAEQAEAFLARFPKTAELIVHCKPGEPGKSVVDECEQPFLRPG